MNTPGRVALDTRGPSMFWRALLAVALMVGFYLLAIAIIAGLLGLVYVMVVHGNRVPVKLLLLCIVGAGAIAISIIPRPDKFVPPGPRLLPEKHPRLFAELRAIAKATGQAMPAEVYLDHDVNAWVAQRGGVMGIGSRRVMGLGLALLRVLSVSELRAVLAHEFGHYYGGDTKLGPWVYKTRSAIGRTIVSLGGGALQAPFVWYGNMFLRVTHAVSRRQEYTADRVAAGVAGRAALISGLDRTHRAGMLFNVFWRTEMVPVLSQGYRPPMAEGFGQFIQVPKLREVVDKALAAEQHQSSPYDTHPAMADRIAALQHCPETAQQANDQPAITLLEDIAALEKQILACMAGPEVVAKLKDADWGRLGETMYLPYWRKMVAEGSQSLAGVTPEAVPQFLWKQRFGANEEAEARGRALVGMALALAGVRAGGALDVTIGRPVVVTCNGVALEPFSVVDRLAKKELSEADWMDQCAKVGICGVDLGIVAQAGEGAAGAGL